MIGVLKRESLQGVPNLKALKIARNELSRVGEGAFTEAPALRHLDLGQNRFNKLDPVTLKGLSALEALNLAENELEDINGLLQSQTALKWLNVSSNNLAWFDYAFVPPSVEWLDISGNEIDALGNYYNLAENYALKYVDASGNKIAALEPTSLLPSVEHILLRDNAIAEVAPNTFVGKNYLATVSLENNRLSTLSMASLMISPLKSKDFHDRI